MASKRSSHPGIPIPDPPFSATCAFCAVPQGLPETQIVLADATCLAFLDHRPIFPGHCLLMPRAHHETLADLPSDLIAPLFANAQRLARAVEQAMAAEGTFVGINNRVSQSVPHLHVHVVPRRKGDGLRGFFWPRQRYPDAAAMEGAADRIRAALAQLQ